MVNKSDIKIRRSRGDQDVVVTALLNDQIITTIRRGAVNVSKFVHISS